MSDRLNRLSTPREILEAALEKEWEAYHFYDDLMKKVKIEMLQDTLEKLRNEEQGHINLLKKMIAAMEFG